MIAAPRIEPFADLNSILLTSLEERWTEDERINNVYYVDCKNRVLQFVDWRLIPLQGLTLEGCARYIQEYLDYRRFRGYSACSIDNDRRNISASITWAQARGLLPFTGNPTSKKILRFRKPPVRCKRPVTREQLESLLVRAKCSDIYPQLMLCLCIGMRPVGASRVLPQDVDWKELSVKVMEKNRERIVPLTDWFVSEVQDWLHPKIGLGWKWKAVHKCTLMHKICALRREAGLADDVTLQALRRTFLKACFEDGMSPQLAAQVAGNSLVTIQKHYVQIETLNSRAAVNRLKFV